MGGKINGYIDCASPYSYFGFKYLRERREQLKQYDVEIEFFPIFLGGVNQATGNKPPSTLPARAKFSPYEMKRASSYFKTPPLSAPPFFPMLSLLPQRCMIAIKSKYPRDKFETAYEACWIWCFSKHRDLSNASTMRELLSEHFSEAEVEEIANLAGSKEIKDQLVANTKTAIDLGAFGAPWFWVTNGNGESEPFFGSDRFYYLFDFLGVEIKPLTILDKSEESSKARL